MVDLEDLKAKAMAADQGPHHIYTHPRDSNKHAENAVFHAACEPQIIIELIDRLQNAETELARLPAKWSEDSSLQTWFPITSEELESLRAENKALKAKIEAARNQEPGQCNCIRWKSKTVAFRAYVDQKTYDGFTPGVQKWYEPILTEQLIKGGENER